MSTAVPRAGQRRLSALGGAAFACAIFLLYNESVGGGLSGAGLGAASVRGGAGAGLGGGASPGGGIGIGGGAASSARSATAAAASSSSLSSFPPRATGAARCAVPPGRKLAILQVKWYHTEVFGSLIEYARACGHEIVVFHRAGHATSALPLYERLFAPLSVRDPGDFRAQHEQFDAIFLTTPDDDIDENFRKSIQHRTIYAAHLTHPKFLHRWHTLRLHMTPLAGFPYAIPVFAGGQAALPAAGRERTVAMIGTVHDGQNYEISKIIDFARAAMADGWNFVVFTRHWGSGEAPPFGVEMVQDANTEAVYERLRRCSFVLVFPGQGSWYTADRVTGALPLAISVGTPIVTTRLLADLYGFSEAGAGVVAADGAEAMGAVGNSAPRYAALVAAVAAYRTRLLANNVAVIELVLRGVPAVARAMAEAGTLGDIMPLADGFAQRQTPELGC